MKHLFSRTLIVAARRTTGARQFSALSGIGLLLLAAVGCGGNSGATLQPTPTPAPNPVPSITLISPGSVSAGGPGFTLVVDGANFVPATAVQWNGGNRPTSFINSSQITAQIAASDIARAGKASVNVTSPSPGGGGSNSLNLILQSTLIAFGSNRALDGSDAANTNGTFNAWVVSTDGTSLLPLTSLTGTIADFYTPVWSPNGTKLAFQSSRALDGSNVANTNNTTNIWVVNPDGTNPLPLTRLTVPGPVSSFNPKWSPDGSKIVFQSSRALDGSDAANTNHTSNIWTVSAAGTNPTPLTRLTTALADCGVPAVSPDGTKVVFESARALDGSDTGTTNIDINIWVMNADGTGATPVTRLTAAGANSFSPVWSPDGKKLAFASFRALDGSNASNAALNIWVMEAEGTNALPLTRMTVSGADSQSPAWSPDGTKILFASARALDGSNGMNANRTFNVWGVDVDGTGAVPLTRLTAANAGNFAPVWSPDGNKITFTSGRALDGGDAANNNGTIVGTPNIWVMNADGSEATPLTRIAATTSTVGGGWRP